MTVRLYVAVRLVTVRLCVAAGRLPMLVRRKVAMLRALTVGHLESFKSCLLFLVALPDLIDTLAQLLAWGPCYMIVYDVGMKVLDTGSFCSAQHRWPDLWDYIYFFIQSGEAFTVEGNKHIHTHTHTHTHTTHTLTHRGIETFKFKLLFTFFVLTLFSKVFLSKQIASSFNNGKAKTYIRQLSVAVRDRDKSEN